MYISTRAATIRNLLVSITNGSLTLIILLIAPLGLASVIVNTLLVTFSTYVVVTVADRVIVWLSPESQAELLAQFESRQQNLKRYSQSSDLERRR